LTALPTPFRDDELDHDTLSRLCEREIARDNEMRRTLAHPCAGRP
jgi:dihydrodipicolinate synthase/N-acetylneuraminate lyase